MANPLEMAIGSALDFNSRLNDLFERLGVGLDQRGQIQTAYRNNNRAIRSALMEDQKYQAVHEVAAGLRSTVKNALQDVLTQAQQEGLDDAAQQLGFYGVKTRPDYNRVLAQQVDYAAGAVLARLDAQIAQAEAIVLADLDPEIITGPNEAQYGIFKPGEVLAAGAFWITALAIEAWSWLIDNHSGPAADGLQFKKQVIAAIDHHTTECCLMAHGQIVGMNEKFHLTGEPRFDDYMAWTPFHWYCRSSIALYSPLFENGITDKMRSSADLVLSERARGVRVERHPASALT